MRRLGAALCLVAAWGAQAAADETQRPAPRPMGIEAPGASEASAGHEAQDPMQADGRAALGTALAAAPRPESALGRVPPPGGPAAIPASANRGPVTNLPLPRYVSLKAAEGNARRGPSLQHRIDWVYTRRSMPLEVTAEFGHWRRVRDRDGAGGWIHYSLLSGVRTVFVDRDMTALRHRPVAGARVLARVEAGVVARLGRCLPDWCRITAGGETGWVPKSALWGVGADEIRE